MKMKKLLLKQILLHLNMEFPVETNGPLLGFLMLRGQEKLSSQSVVIKFSDKI